MPLPADARLFAVVPAAGVGRRMGTDRPKQYLQVAGRTVLEHTMQRLLTIPGLERIVVAISSEDRYWPELDVVREGRISTTVGGATRADSVLNALDALAADAAPTDWVLVHDVARPCLRVMDVERLLRETGEQGAILAAPVVDTVKRRADDGAIEHTLDRSRIWRALTPQLFPLGALRDALREGLARHVEITDEASAMEATGWRPLLVEGSTDNIKLTVAEDLPLVEFHLRRQEREQ